jgi:hypothetical protein
MSATQPPLPRPSQTGSAPAADRESPSGQQRAPAFTTQARASAPREDLQPATNLAARTWRCGCGADYRIVGSGRHRIYWPLQAPPDQPITDGRCAQCGSALPGKQPH